MGSVAHLITRKWVAGLLALFAILGTGAVIGLVGQAESPATGTAALPTGTDSRAAAELRDQLPAGRGLGGGRALQQRPALTADAARRGAGAARTLPGATGAPPVVAEDGTAATVVVPVDDQGRRRDRRGRRPTCAPPPTADLPEGVTAQVTGPAAIQADLAAVFDGANFRLLAATASVVAILLVHHLPQPVPLAGAADRRRRRRPAGRRAGHPHPRAPRRALGRVDDRHPLGAGLRRRHRLRPAADLPLPRRAAGHRRTAARRWPSPYAAPPRPCSPARPPWCSACSPCCSRCSRPPAASASPAPSASSSPRPSRWSCCPPRWSSSAGGCSGRGCPHVGEPALADGHVAVAPGRRRRRARARRLRHRHRGRCSASWPAASPRSRPGSTRPTSSSRSPRRSRRASGSPSRSRPAPPTRPTW